MSLKVPERGYFAAFSMLVDINGFTALPQINRTPYSKRVTAYDREPLERPIPMALLLRRRGPEWPHFAKAAV